MALPSKSVQALNPRKSDVRAIMEVLSDRISESRKSGRATGFFIEVNPKGQPRVKADRPQSKPAASGGEDDLQSALDAARERGRLRAAEILNGEEMLPADAFAELLGISRVTVNAKRQRHEVLALDGAKRGFRFPAWQVGENGKPLAGTEAERKAADPKQDATGAERKQAGNETKPQGEGRPGEAKKNDGSGANESKDKNASKTGEQKESGQQGKPNEGKQDGAGNKGDSQGEKTGQESQRDQAVKPNERQAKEALEQLRKDLQSSDAATREAAQKKLETLRKLAQDPAVRKAAEEMKAAQEKEKQGAGKGNEPEKGTESKAGSQQAGEPQKQGQPGSNQKQGEQGKPGNTQNGTSEGQKQTSPDGKGAEGAKQPSAGNNPSKGPGQIGEAQPPPGQGKAAEGQGNRPDSPPGQGEPVDSKSYRNQAGDLILDKVKKNVTDNVLKEAGLTQAEYEQFMKAYEKMLKEDRQRAADQEKLPAPFQGGVQQPNRGVRKVDAVTDPKFRAEQSGPASAPTEFGDAYKKFTRGMAEIGAKSDKK